MARSDAEGDCAESAVGRRMGVAASDGHSGVNQSLFGHNDVYNALFSGCGVEESDAVILAVLADCRKHFVCGRTFVGFRAVVRRDYMVYCGVCARGIFYGKLERAEHTERLGTRHFVKQVRAHKQLCRAVGQFSDGVFFPNFFKKRFFHMLRFKCFKKIGAEFVDESENIRTKMKSAPCE